MVNIDWKTFYITYKKIMLNAYKFLSVYLRVTLMPAALGTRSACTAHPVVPVSALPNELGYLKLLVTLSKGIDPGFIRLKVKWKK